MTGSRHLVSAEAQKLVKLLSAQPQDARLISRQVVTLRSCFEFDGRPDWAGRSQDYRDVIYRVYKDAGIPSDSSSGSQANLRYHIGNAVWEQATAADRVALGLDADVGDQASQATPRHGPDPCPDAGKATGRQEGGRHSPGLPGPESLAHPPLQLGPKRSSPPGAVGYRSSAGWPL